MSDEKIATFAADVSGFFTQTAAMYHLSPPFVVRRIDTIGAEYDEVTEHVVVVTTRIFTGQVTTLVLRCDETSYVQSWNRLDPWTPGRAPDSDALKRIGYTIKEGEGDGRK